ncbi:LysR substrate-binding domain-containing protein [Acinetobacter nosocomialis]|uniref:LysR substrate-binding domain-containing protein n=1 Tax=Acinetobacter nosocomialis TaxID=106654 RepID=UPI0026EFBD62|nr:LysR substrate-binding domain-containing protein [Acinetobacter nosocomialis]MDO7192593.1 LysR substrate-binding domain-containing protein [Acinetobacter nosocomialis]MDO7217317.1 LysR substrate-binding domain-containing protein [Acinetobacter nosocomialis]MDX7934805.1 LysR substrate-binding domain-containing protein [Acinetobacter baumannii]
MNKPIYLNALKAFEASARYKSFSEAAQELNVTPAAVGQLVRALEDYLGFPLFYRQSKGKNRLITTEVAEMVLPDIQAGFDKLAIGLEKLKLGSSTGVLTVTVSPAFATKWLLPRIDQFQNKWPDLNVRLDMNLKTIDFLANKIDIGIRYGEGGWADLDAIKIMDEEVYPVCSPSFLQNRDSKICLEDLLTEILIHDQSMEAHSKFPTWEKWLEAAGFSSFQNKRNIQINNSAAVLQTTMDGHGIALARSVMVQDDIRAGRLIRLFPNINYQSPLSYYIVYRHELSNLPRILAFKEWMIQESYNFSSLN